VPWYLFVRSDWQLELELEESVVVAKDVEAGDFVIQMLSTAEIN
jgi:hypothetical protein